MAHTLSVLLLFCILAPFSKAQSGLKRIELDLKEARSEHHIVPVGANGLLVYYEEREPAKGGLSPWNFILYNTDLEKAWEKTHHMPRSATVDHHMADEDFVYLLIEEKKSKRIGTVDIKTGNYQDNPVEMHKRLAPDGFSVNDGVVYVHGLLVPSTMTMVGRYCGMMCVFPFLLGWTTPNEPSLFYTVPLDNHRPNLERVSQDKRAKMDGFSNITGTNKVAIQVVENFTKEHALSIHIYENGKKTEAIKLRPGNRNILLKGAITMLDNGNYLVLGTYHVPKKDKRHPMAYPEAHGMYVSMIEGGKQKYIKYYPFSKFKNFLKFLSQGRQQRVQSKQEKRERKGKQTDLGIRMLFHEPMEKDNEIFVVGECYYPTYRTETYVTVDAQGRPVTQTRRVFDGWQWTHAVVAGFDYEGKLLWDNQFPVDVKSFKLKERVRILPDGDDLLMVYSYSGSLVSRVVRGSEVLDAKTIVDIETLYPKDKVRGNFNSMVEHWYDNTFVAHGSQRIRDTDKRSGKARRTVFYVNKFEYVK
jgi:hypothetical protein